MEIDLSNKNLTWEERDRIEHLLTRESRTLDTDLEQIWYLMDLVCDDLKCNNKNLDQENIEQYYSHPVWLLNGLFIEQDKVSMGHRHAIADWVARNGSLKVIDYGGGFGTLARLIAEKCTGMQVDIFEPHPSRFGLKRTGEFQNITIVDKLDSDYDCLISTDVLEHVPDPLSDFSGMIESVKVGGHLVVANAFFPVIKCHLPRDFHFRYSFNIFARIMGLEKAGALQGSHATIYRKTDSRKHNWKKIRFYERLSRLLFPFLETAMPVARPVKRLSRLCLSAKITGACKT